MKNSSQLDKLEIIFSEVNSLKDSTDYFKASKIDIHEAPAIINRFNEYASYISSLSTSNPRESYIVSQLTILLEVGSKNAQSAIDSYLK